MDLRQGPIGVRAFANTTSVLGALTLGWAVLSLRGLLASLPPWEIVALLGVIVVACVSARWVVRVPRTDNYIAVADTLMLAVTMIYGVVAGVVANGVFYLVSYWFATRRPSPHDVGGNEPRWNDLQAAFNMGAGALYALIFGSVFFAVLPEGEAVGASDLVLPVILMAATYFLVNSFLTDAVQALAGRGSFVHLWLQNLPLVPLYFLASASGAAIVFLFHQFAGPVLVLPRAADPRDGLLRAPVLQRQVRAALPRPSADARGLCLLYRRDGAPHRLQAPYAHPHPEDAGADGGTRPGAERGRAYVRRPRLCLGPARRGEDLHPVLYPAQADPAHRA